MNRHRVRIVGFVALTSLVVTVAAFAISPWPSAMLIRAVFTKDAADKSAALEKHSPGGVRRIANENYGSGDPDTTFDVYVPETATEALPTIVWAHGGAWISGSKDDTVPYFELLAEAGFTVVGINYSIGPEKQYPTAVTQYNDALAYLVKHADRYNIDPERIVLAGDSAGSQLSSQVAALTTNPAYADFLGITPALDPDQLRGVILNCGIYEMSLLTGGSGVIGWGIAMAMWAYTGERDADNSDILAAMSTMRHVTSEFPPAFISGGNGDELTESQSRPLAEKLTGMGVDVTTLFWPEDLEPALPHEYQFVLDNPEGQKALTDMIAFARLVTDDGPGWSATTEG